MLTDIIWTHFPQIDIFSIDTGRLHEETYALLETLQHRYQRRSASCTRTPSALEQSGRAPGRQRLLRAVWRRAWSAAASARWSRSGAPIAGFPAWITGVRREQSAGRAHGQLEEWDSEYGALQAQPAAGLERGGGVAVHPRAPAAVQCAARPTVPEHRLLAVHPCHPAGREPARRALVVGATRVARMRPPSKTSSPAAVAAGLN